MLAPHAQGTILQHKPDSCFMQNPHPPDRSTRAVRPAWQWWCVVTCALALPAVIAPLLAPAVGWRLDSVITRLMMILGLGALLWRFGLPRRSWWRDTMGENPWRGLTIAFALTITCCALFSVALVGLSAEALRPEVFRPDRLVTAILTGLLVSLVEEPVFRHALRHRLSFRGMAYLGNILASMLYALAHYIRPSKVPAQDNFGIEDSLTVYSEMLTNLARPLSDPAPFLGLFLLGVLLCAVARRRGLAWTIGIHAGLVYYMKVDACLLYWNYHHRHWLAGSGHFKYDGALFWAACALCLVSLTLFSRASRSAASGAATP